MGRPIEAADAHWYNLVVSHSDEARRENKNCALRSMAQAAEDLMILEKIFRPSDREFESIYQTTWTELEDEHLIEPASPKGPIEYRLTGHGWIAGLRLSERWESQDFKEKAGQLSRALKKHVKGRHDADALVSFSEVCQQCRLPDGFVYNAIESHLLQKLNCTHDAKWADSKRHVLVPRTFGLPIIPQDTTSTR